MLGARYGIAFNDEDGVRIVPRLARRSCPGPEDGGVPLVQYSRVNRYQELTIRARAVDGHLVLRRETALARDQDGPELICDGRSVLSPDDNVMEQQIRPGRQEDGAA